MTDTDVRDALTRASGHLDPAPDLLDRVRAGGRRRVVRRRSVLGGALAALAVGAVPAVRAVRGAPVTATAAGDLGRDAELLERVRAAWRSAVPGLSGQPYVHWAGNTPAGPVALITQSSADTVMDHQGFVETVGGRLRVVAGTLLVEPGTVGPAAILAGAGRDVLVLATGGQSVWYSETYEINAAGRVDRTFVQVPDQREGVVVYPRVDNTGIALMLSGGRTPRVPILNFDERFGGARPVRIERVLPGAGTARLTDSEKIRWDLGRQTGFLDPYGYHFDEGPAEWYLRGRTADGRRLVVQTLVLNGEARVFCLVGAANSTPVVHYLGAYGTGVSARLKVPGGDVLVLRARLPEKLGVAVAADKCQLRFRVRDGAWLPVSGNAAVLPEAATELEVTPPDGAAIVPLPLP
ncbi:hypothetical protein JIG36_31160 [Actinoplanes sp. LDG1-06]|uniref:Uncharacterized protein n=1 Tax=Paractinoplanes ovalisporus TaxID=2810368 RepID=A0ABS2AJE7_9ACTN|nr:hypothetical protein [Actinoplanes ovalisporus]MBM2619982.1 hypothetical protein [Actinoplanes ovalisporus]